MAALSALRLRSRWRDLCEVPRPRLRVAHMACPFGAPVMAAEGGDLRLPMCRKTLPSTARKFTAGSVRAATKLDFRPLPAAAPSRPSFFASSSLSLQVPFGACLSLCPNPHLHHSVFCSPVPLIIEHLTRDRPPATPLAATPLPTTHSRTFTHRTTTSRLACVTTAGGPHTRRVRQPIKYLTYICNLDRFQHVPTTLLHIRGRRRSSAVLASSLCLLPAWRSPAALYNQGWSSASAERIALSAILLAAGPRTHGRFGKAEVPLGPARPLHALPHAAPGLYCLPSLTGDHLHIIFHWTA